MKSFDHVPLGTSSPVESLRGEIDRLTVLRDITLEPPLVALIGLMEELLAEDWQAYNVCWSYHEFVSAILHAGAPCVLHDPWRDYLLYVALERDHLFSLRSCAGTADKPLLAAFAGDLRVLQQLYLLDDGMIRSWCRQITHTDSEWVGWAGEGAPDYGAGQLAQMRCRVNLSEDWGQLAPALHDFFRNEGSGIALAARRLYWDGSELTAYPYASGQMKEKPFPAHEAGAHILIKGDPADIKRELLSRVLPENASLVMASPAALDYVLLWKHIAGLPRQFHVCFDAREGEACPAPLLTALPQNVRLCAVLPRGLGAPSWAVTFEHMDLEG